MPSYSVPRSFPAVPDGFHAYLHADIRAQSSDVGSSVYPALRGEKITRATASTHLLQQRSQLHGRRLATLRLQTNPAERPKEPLYLTGVSPHKQPVEVTSRVWWSAAGLVAAHPDELIVFSSTSRSTPPQMCYRRRPRPEHSGRTRPECSGRGRVVGRTPDRDCDLSSAPPGGPAPLGAVAAVAVTHPRPEGRGIPWDA